MHWGWRWIATWSPAARLPSGVRLHAVRTTEEVEEPLGRTWARFFPSVPARERERYPYPPPLTEAFWRLYAEPVEDFLDAARALRDALGQIKARTDRARGIDLLN